jgi:hypothetical protein
LMKKPVVAAELVAAVRQLLAEAGVATAVA